MADENRFPAKTLEGWARLAATERDRRGLLFLGNFRHTPNVEALGFLMREIVPRLPACRTYPDSGACRSLDPSFSNTAGTGPT